MVVGGQAHRILRLGGDDLLELVKEELLHRVGWGLPSHPARRGRGGEDSAGKGGEHDGCVSVCGAELMVRLLMSENQRDGKRTVQD